MSIRTRTPSIFRPQKPIDQSVLSANRALVDDINRRNLLRGAISLGALTLLTGCDVSEEPAVQSALRAVSSWNDGVQELLFLDATEPEVITGLHRRVGLGRDAALELFAEALPVVNRFEMT